MINFSPIRFEIYFIKKYVQLFAQCFPAGSKFNINYLEWLYCKNPLGSAIGFDAWDGNELAAHYVLIPLNAYIDGLKVRALLSINTATHPSYQGRGLFVKLAEYTYAAASELGFSAVYGVANANSTPGFTRKLGFQLVEPLNAKVGFGSLGIDLDRVKKEAQFRVDLSKAFLEWRCSNPNNMIVMDANEKCLKLYASTMGQALLAYAELAMPDETPLCDGIDKYSKLRSPLRLYLGLSPTGTIKSNTYLNIPSRLRPSPLNFIYRSLSKSAQRLEPGTISMSFVDFDAY